MLYYAHRLHGCHPRLWALSGWIAVQVDFDVVVVEGKRSTERQRKLYAQGRTEPGEKVTDAPPGSSAHEYGLAVDLAPYDSRKGVTLWNDTAKFQAMRKVADGFAGIRPNVITLSDGTKDWPHFEVKDWHQHKDWMRTFALACAAIALIAVVMA